MKRTGVVLDRSGGALPALAKPFMSYMGGAVGTGRQVMSWISLRDAVNAIVFIIDTPSLTGAVNLTSPRACPQKDFARALGQALGKPTFMHTPAFMIKAAMEQLGEELVLTGQRVNPTKLLQAGFTFQDTDIQDFLRTVYA